MVTEKLTYQDVCRQAEDAYRLQYDRKEWPPASHATDTRVPSATFGNVALPEGSAITRAEILNLIQSQTPRQDTPKKGNCHNCGKPVIGPTSVRKGIKMVARMSLETELQPTQLELTKLSLGARYPSWNCDVQKGEGQGVQLCSNLAVHALRSIPWTLLLTSIVDTLRQVLLEQPTLFLAPALALLATSFWKPEACQQETNATTSTSFTRKQRRRFAKLLKTSLKPQREVQHRKAVAPLPYRLRKRRHQNAFNAPTLERQTSLRDLDELKTRTLLLQRQTQRLRTRRSPYVTNALNKESSELRVVARKLNAKASTSTEIPSRSCRRRPDAFVPAPWTTQQRNAAHKIISTSISLAPPRFEWHCKRQRMRNALGSATNSAPIIWDSGASISISPDPEDFQGTMRSPGTITQLKE
ncbi:hypothetical protein MHU86_12814 [Fragilaria crotonensis]|nr:hypothetical protein MHU86_12814 [Fragilaria crotonensis]